jgi:site-specific DNA recombinase
MSNSPGRVHIYCRVSSSGQEDNTSLDSQEASCRAWARERELSVVSVEREVWSGGDRHRPQLDSLLDRLLPGDTVLAYALDRLSRSQVDTAILIDRIENSRARLRLVSEDFEQSATGTFLRNAKAFVAELEREKIVERTQRGMRARVASGKPLVGCKPPYGYHWNADKTRLGLDSETAPVVRMIFDWALDGVSLRAIVYRLRDRGILSPSGKPYWAPTVLRDLLRRTVYTGTATAYQTQYERLPDGSHLRRRRGPDEQVTLPGIAPAIVTAEERAAVLARLDANKAASTRNNREPEATLLRAGFIHCGHCGNRLTVTRHPERGASYRCDWGTAHRHNCPRPTILAHMIDPLVWDVVARVLRHPAIIACEVKRRQEDDSLARDLAAVEGMLATVADKQARIAKRVAAIDDDDVAAPLVAELHALATSKKSAQQERDDLQRRISDEKADATRLRSLSEWCQTVATNLDGLTYAEKRLALEGLGVKVRIWRPGAMNEHGKSYPRWQITLDPMLPLSSGSRPASETAFAPLPVRLVSGTACGGASSPA